MAFLEVTKDVYLLGIWMLGGNDKADVMIAVHRPIDSDPEKWTMMLRTRRYVAEGPDAPDIKTGIHVELEGSEEAVIEEVQSHATRLAAMSSAVWKAPFDVDFIPVRDIGLDWFERGQRLGTLPDWMHTSTKPAGDCPCKLPKEYQSWDECRRDDCPHRLKDHQP